MPAPPRVEDTFAYYAKLAHWSSEVAVTLLLGRDPRIALQKSLRDSRSRFENTPEYRELNELFDSARHKIGHLSEYNPARVIEWATFNDIPIPAKLFEFVKKYKGPLQDWDWSGPDKVVQRIC